MHFDKFISISESNNAEVLGWSLQPLEASGVLVADPLTLRWFYSFFQKNTHF